MRIHWSLWLIGIFLGALITLQAFTPAARWERHTRAGRSDLMAGNYPEAERQFLQALDEAKQFGAADPRFDASLRNLGMLYQAETKAAGFEPLPGRGPESPGSRTTTSSSSVRKSVSSGKSG